MSYAELCFKTMLNYNTLKKNVYLIQLFQAYMYSDMFKTYQILNYIDYQLIENMNTFNRTINNLYKMIVCIDNHTVKPIIIKLIRAIIHIL